MFKCNNANSTKWSNTLKPFIAVASEFFKCVWPFCGVGPYRVKLKAANLNSFGNFLLISTTLLCIYVELFSKMFAGFRCWLLYLKILCHRYLKTGYKCLCKTWSLGRLHQMWVGCSKLHLLAVWKRWRSRSVVWHPTKVK